MGQFDYRLQTKSGEWRWVANYGKVVTRDQQGNPLRMLGTHRDVDDRKRAEECVKQSDRRFRAIFDTMFQFMGLLTPEGILIEANQTALEFGGLRPGDVINRPFWETRWWTISSDIQTQLQAAIAQATAGQFIRYEVEVLGVGNTTAIIDFSLKPIHDETGKVVLLITEGRDITEQKRAEEQLQASLREKEVLLKEVHHRVKNNLGVVDGLLAMQARRAASQIPQGSSNLEVTAALKESQNRIASIVLVHEKLYGADDLANINFAQYISDLTAHLFDSYNIHANQIKLTTHIEPISLDIDTAIPCGLIINELVSNALKYAFPGPRTGEIQVIFQQNPNQTLIVRDNGIGLPQDFNLQQTKTLGISLIQGLVKQLRGTLAISGQPGTTVKITFASVKS